MPGPVVASLADGHGSAIVASLECIVAPDLCAGDDRFRCRTDVDPTRNVCLRGDKPLERAPVFSRPRGVLIVLGGLLVANLLERSLLNHSRTSQYAPGVVRAVVAIGHDMGMARRLAAGGRKAARVLAGSQGRAFGAVHIGPAEGSRLEESAWAVCMQDFPLAGLPRLVCFLVGGSQRYRQDRILADSMGWMCRRWTRRRSKAMLPEPTRCGSPMRREPACLSMPLIGSGHVANHDCAVSCRVDDGASACRRFDLICACLAFLLFRPWR